MMDLLKKLRLCMCKNKKKIANFLINGVVLGVVVGILSGVITPYISTCIVNSQPYNIRNKKIEKIDIGVNNNYIDNLLGYPLYSKIDSENNVTENLYSVEGAVLRCYYLNDKIIGYFITKTNNDFNNKITAHYFDDDIVLGKSTFEDYSEQVNNLVSYCTLGNSHQFAMEHYYGAMHSNYCELYYGILDYGVNENDNFISMGKDCLNDRCIAVPNTVGISLTKYTDLIIEYISNYNELNLRWLYENNNLTN